MGKLKLKQQPEIESQLGHRKKILLETAITSYIDTAEPVASQALQCQLPFALSSATIRHELSELEAAGYLTHVHTSSGRVPTDKGYRLYVDSLMQAKDLDVESKRRVLGHLRRINANVSDVLNQMSVIVASMLNYPTLVLTPDICRESLKVIHLISVDIDKILVVLLNSVGVNHEFLVKISDYVDQDSLNRISQLLTKKLEGKTLDGISPTDFGSLIGELPEFKGLLTRLQSEVKTVVSHHRHQNLITQGVAQLVQLPDFQDLQVMQQVIRTIEEARTLCGLLSEAMVEGPKTVVIGSENPVPELQSCSMVMAPIKIDQTVSGVIAVLGPKRMAYTQVVPLVSEIGDLVHQYLETSGDPDPRSSKFKKGGKK